jgi:hypothetical protein
MRLDGPTDRLRADPAVADLLTRELTGVRADATAGGQADARSMMKDERGVSVRGRPPIARRASRGMLRYRSQRDLVRASLLLVPERPKTPTA